MNISLQNVRVSLGGHLIISDTSLDIDDGSSTSIVGPSGAGKTTLLRLIAGLQKPESGRVTIGGESPESLHALGVMSLLFQTPSLWPSLTVAETIAVTYRLHRTDADEEKVAAVLRLVGLEHAEHLYPNQLSVGMRARLAVARAFCVPPRLLLMDEPFAAVDPFRRADLAEKTEDLRRRWPCTVVRVTHDLDEAVRFSTHVVVLATRPARVVAQVALGSEPFGRASGSLPARLARVRDELFDQIMATESEA